MTIALGIDVAEARKGLDLVVLGAGRNVIACRAHCTVADVVDTVADLRPDVVCIDSPPAWALDGRSRLAERELRRLGITAFATPLDPGPHRFYGWMRCGFAIFDAIAETHPRYREGPVSGTAAEVFPEATAALLAGRLRSADEPKSTFRRAVLADQGIDATPLRSIDSVDAALAALTGVIALDHGFSTVGDPAEGVIVLPVASLPDCPLTRDGSWT